MSDNRLNIAGNRLIGLYYKASGAFSPLGILLPLLLGGLASLGLGLAYGFLTKYNPFIYINFLATLGYGFVLSLVCWFGAKKGNLRSPGLALFIGATVGLMGCYTNWVGYIRAIFGEAAWAWDPQVLWVQGIQVLAQEGAWSLKTWTPTGGVLYAFWGVEAALIVGMSAFFVWQFVGSTPFCEKCNAWADEEYSGLRMPPPGDTVALTGQLEGGNIAVLGELQWTQPDKFTDVDLNSCPTCKQVGFLTVKAVTLTINKKGERDESSETLAENLILSHTGIDAARKLVEIAANDPGPGADVDAGEDGDSAAAASGDE